MKKKRKHNIFPILTVATPFALFSIISLYRYFRGGEISATSYFNNFKYLLGEAKHYKQYLLPTLIFLIVSLSTVFITHSAHKKMVAKRWIILAIIGEIIVLCGSRIIFLILNRYTGGGIFKFIYNGINAYTVTLAMMLTFIVLSIAFAVNIWQSKK